MRHFRTPLAQVEFQNGPPEKPPRDQEGHREKEKKKARVQSPTSGPASNLPRWATLCSLLGLSVPVSSFLKCG